LAPDQCACFPGRRSAAKLLTKDEAQRIAVNIAKRHGNDFTARFPLVASAVAALPARSCVIDGEAIVCDENGLAVFELIRGGGSKTSAVLCASDLLELDGRDLRRRPIEERKGLLAKLLHDPNLSLDTAMEKSGIVLNQHFEEDGEIVFKHACKLGCEGIVSKRLGSIYRSGRSPLWLKVKNPNAPAVKAEEDWGR
jgi:bifunctional non-homologous end joining protein LigD